MAVTPIELFRVGNKSSARLDYIRNRIDVVIFRQNGVDLVKGRSGGISTFAAIDPALSGTWWHLAAGSPYDDKVLFLWEDVPGHWSWEPTQDMPLADYWAALAAVNSNFIPV